MIDVSIVIVSMNNLKVLRPCLDSIRKYTQCSYELFVVAYLYKEENLKILKDEYPWVQIIESNEIRGFAENNNLALRKASGRYCFVVNDDTFIKTPVIDKLVTVMSTLPNKVAILSPNLLYPDGRKQMCGRRKYTWKTWIPTIFQVDKFFKSSSIYEDQSGVFESYNISGAAFLIKTEIFKDMGWFDEYYFFCPEDIALSEGLQRKGYKCYVDADNVIYHIASGTASKVMMATMPACLLGSLAFYADGSKFLRLFLATLLFISKALLAIGHGVKSIGGNERSKILYQASLNVCRTIFGSQTPKEVFTRFYKR